MIFNTVIVGAGSGGGGSEVVAKAIGAATTATAGDRVLLREIHKDLQCYTIVGSPTITGTVISDLSSTDYIQSPFIDFTVPFEFEYSAQVGNTGIYQKIVNVSGPGQVDIGLTSSNEWYFFNLRPVNTSSNLANTGIYLGVYSGEILKGKLVWDGSSYKHYRWSSGNWTQTNSFSYDGDKNLGKAFITLYAGGEEWRGSIDLADWKLTQNGVVVWSPMWDPDETLQPYEGIYRYYAYIDSDANYVSEGTITGFVKSNDGVTPLGDTELTVECLEDPDYDWENEGIFFGDLQVNEGEPA